MPVPTDYNVQVPDIGPVLSTIAGAIEDRRERKRLSEIGGMIQGGNLSGAAGMAFGQGDLQTGVDLTKMDQDRQAKIGSILANAARQADDPQKWSQFIDVVGKRFPGANLDAYRDFDSRGLVLAEFPGEAPEFGSAGRAIYNKSTGEIINVAPSSIGDENKPPAGYRWTPEGDLEAIPGGPAAAGRTANAPVGYRWADTPAGERVLEPIPGGPAEKLPAELSARVGMAETYLKPENVKPLMEGIGAGDATGPIDWAAGKMGYGKSGEIHRQLSSGVDALRRMLTGAGMNMAEANEYLARYQPRMTDNAEILTSKVKRLNEELAAISKAVKQGREPAAAQGATRSADVTPPADIDAVLQEANDAIEAGADRAAVIEELRRMGVEVLEDQ